jgi:hypothetical protein
VDLLALHTEVRGAVGAACERSGLGRAWPTTTVRPSTGDGLLAVRAALRDSDPDVTLAAAIISAETFETYVSGGYTGLRPSQFTPVRVPMKPFDRLTYLHAPAPSARRPESGPTEPGGPVPGGAALYSIGHGVGGRHSRPDRGRSMEAIRRWERK